MPRGARIVFVNRFYRPDHSATAQILTDLAEALAARGWHVTVITSRLRYDDPAVRLAAREAIAGVEVRRVWTSRFGRAGIAGRLIDYLSFYASAFFAMLGAVGKGDVLVTKTDPPLLSVAGLIAARLKRARHVTWLQDLYPEVAAELGIEAMRGPAGKLLRGLRNWSLRGSALNVAIGERMQERLVGEGVPADRIAVMPNWSDDEAVRPIAREAIALREEWGVQDRFTVAYSGNLGRAHEAETLLGAARILRGDPGIVFLMIGGGHASGALAQAVAAEGLENFRFLPYQPREQLAESLGAGDVHWLSLLPPLEGLIVPSKFYGIAAAGRPVISVTDLDGEVARLVTRHGCGIAVAPGDSQRLADALIRLRDDSPARHAMGQSARAMLDTHYSRAATIERWDALFEGLATSNRSR